MLAGVCGGIADYFGLDPTTVRIVWAVGALNGLQAKARAQAAFRREIRHFCKENS
jgi:hypothetical protein